MTLRLLWNTAFSASPLAGIISMIYGCAFSFFIYDYNDAGNFTFHIYGYSLKKKKPASCSKQLSWSSPAFWLQAPMQACHCLLMFLASQAAQYLKSKRAPSVILPVLCLPTDSTPHSSPMAASLVSHQQVRRSSLWVPGCRFFPTSCCRAAAPDPAAIHPQPGCSRADCAHVPTAWLHSRAAGEG